MVYPFTFTVNAAVKHSVNTIALIKIATVEKN